MARIAVFNQKGGVGKTTTALNLAAAIAARGRVPVAIDLDPQGHLSAIAGVLPSSPEASVYAFYRDARPLSGLVAASSLGWPVIPAHIELAKVDTQFGKGPNVLNRLRVGLARDGLGEAGCVLIDCCPMLGVLSLSAIFAAERVLVPVSADYLAVKGAMQVDRTLNALSRVVGRRIERRYVITRFDGRRRMSWDILETFKARFGADLAESRISENVSIAESPFRERDVFAHAPASRGAADYAALHEELEATGFLGEAPGPAQREPLAAVA
ncbi:MAG: ParA family protein [Burkholderiales bacterium]|nr:ParA family protein [Burkholderiales bacterium]